MKNTFTEAIADKTEEELFSIGNLPLGQKLLALGLKSTTEQALRDHFGADALEKKLNEKQDKKERLEAIREKREEAVKKGREEQAEKKKEDTLKALKEELSTMPYHRIFKRKELQTEISKLEMRSMFNFPRFSPIRLGLWGLGSTRHQVRLVHCKLENYMEDTIPQYCLDQIETARELGLDNFEVVYPVIEEVKQPDPVIVSMLGDKMIWVTFYE